MSGVPGSGLGRHHTKTTCDKISQTHQKNKLNAGKTHPNSRHGRIERELTRLKDSGEASFKTPAVAKSIDLEPTALGLILRFTTGVIKIKPQMWDFTGEPILVQTS